MNNNLLLLLRLLLLLLLLSVETGEHVTNDQYHHFQAPEIYYKSVRNDLHLHTVSEMARFSEALSGTGSPLQATPGRSLTVLHFKF